MNFNRLDLNLLVALDALLSEQSTTNAGERLHLTQSATSAALARLRGYFGDELLVPVGRRMVLTPLGHSLVQPIRDILIRIRATSEMRPTFDPQTATRAFSFVMSDYLATILMTEVTRMVQQLAPHVSIEILTPGDTPAQLLERGDIDFLLMPEPCLSPLHPSAPLLQDGYVCAVWNDNPLVGEQLSIDQYMSLGHVERRFCKSTGPTTMLDHFWLGRGYTRKIEVIVPTFDLVPQFIVGTTRIATLHTRLAKLYARHLSIRLVPLPIDPPALREAIQWHQYWNQDPGSIWMRQILKEAVKRGDSDFSEESTLGRRVGEPTGRINTLGRDAEVTL
jgi:DNA-binding transcriptional LysR family regulator